MYVTFCRHGETPNENVQNKRYITQPTVNDRQTQKACIQIQQYPSSTSKKNYKIEMTGTLIL